MSENNGRNPTLDDVALHAGVSAATVSRYINNPKVVAAATGPVDPVPLKAMGRFNREAAAVDPASGIAPGQAAVFYDGSRVVGSATISASDRVGNQPTPQS